MSHLFARRPSGVVFEHLQDAFDLKRFFQQLNFYVAMGRFPRPIAHILGVVRFLALGKPSSSIRLIVVGKVFYRLDKKALCF